MIYLMMIFNVALLNATYVPVVKKTSRPVNTITGVHQLLSQLTLVFGIGMVLMSLHKYMEHRQNPLAHPMSSVVSFLLVGAALIGLSFVPIQHLN